MLRNTEIDTLTSGFRKLTRSCRHLLERTPLLGTAVLPSAGYKLLTRSEAECFNERASGWQSPRSARRQESAYQDLLANVRAGRPRADFRVVAEAIEATQLSHPSVLEVGCGNGYYSEILARLVHGDFEYFGLDSSPAMVDRARLLYPNTKFERGDATNMAFATSSYDILLNGVCLMHIFRYAAAIQEAVRVAKYYVIFNCVPVMEGHPTIYLKKFAYGEPTIEIIFSTDELKQLFDAAGLKIVKTWKALEYDLQHLTGIRSTMLTYLCRVHAQP